MAGSPKRSKKLCRYWKKGCRNTLCRFYHPDGQRVLPLFKDTEKMSRNVDETIVLTSDQREEFSKTQIQTLQRECDAKICFSGNNIYLYGLKSDIRNAKRKINDHLGIDVDTYWGGYKPVFKSSQIKCFSSGSGFSAQKIDPYSFSSNRTNPFETSSWPFSASSSSMETEYGGPLPLNLSVGLSLNEVTSVKCASTQTDHKMTLRTSLLERIDSEADIEVQLLILL